MVNLNDKIEAVIRQMQEVAIPEILNNAKEIFEKHANLNSFGIFMYANYFNDGDACPFYIRDYEFNINGNRCYDGEIDEVKEGLDYPTICKDLTDFTRCIGDELAQRIFGNDQCVTFYRNGTYTNDSYGEHD